MRVLSVDGGGYLGLATAAFIEGVERHFQCRFSDVFDLFCGTSTGAVLALGLAAGKSGEELVRLYQEFGPTVFPPEPPGLRGKARAGRRMVSALRGAKYDNELLRATLERELRTEGRATRLGDLAAAGKFALVPAYCVSTGTVRVFKTDHFVRAASGSTKADEYSTDNGLSLVDVIMASTAAPTYLPMVSMVDQAAPKLFCDGGVAANHPALLGLVEAVYALKAEWRDVKVLSLSTPREDRGEGPPGSTDLDRGLVGWAPRLPGMFVDASSAMAHEVLRRLVGTFPEPRPIYERISLENKQRLAMDRADGFATEALLLEGSTRAANQDERAKVGRVIHSESEP